MGWADNYIMRLIQGETVQFRPRGNSMVPKINSGDLCTVEPIQGKTLKRNDIVLCKVKGNQYLHLVTALNKDHVQISNNQGHVNGWTGLRQVYGILTKVEK